MEKFTYLGSSISSTENDIKTRLAKAWVAICRQLVLRKSDLFGQIKRSFFSKKRSYLFLYRCSTSTLSAWRKSLKAITQECYNLYWTNPGGNIPQNLLPPISKAIQIRRTRHAGHCWRSKDELISNVFLWTPSDGRASVGRPARTYLQQLCTDIGCSMEDLLGAVDERDEWRERVREIRANNTTRWWWWWLYHITE